MIFSHAPAGFLASFLTKKWWGRGLNTVQTRTLLILATIFGIIPDLDVFYYYLFNAQVLHREIILHSFFVYALITIIIIFVSHKFKNRFWQAVGIVFFIGTFSHLLLDSLAAGVMWLYPIQSRLFGLLIVPTIANSFFGQYFTLINFIFEFSISFFAIGLVVYNFFPRHKKSFHIISASLSILLVIIITLTLPRTFRTKHPGLRYQDMDHDGIMNLYDADMDNDKKAAFDDKDTDNDKTSNNDEIIETALSMNGKLRDPLNGRFFEIMSRYGFITDTDIIRNSYEAAGIFLPQLMIEDYQKNPHLYQNSPKSSVFSRNIYNVFIFFRNNGMLVDGNKDTEKGDTIFYGNDFKHVGIIVRKNDKLEKEVLVIDGLSAKVVLNSDAISKFGTPLAAVRLKKR